MITDFPILPDNCNQISSSLDGHYLAIGLFSDPICCLSYNLSNPHKHYIFQPQKNKTGGSGMPPVLFR